MRVPLQESKFEHFVEVNESFLSTVEDFALSMLLMYYDHGKGAHIPEYSMTIAKGKSAMMSTFLRWDGGKLAVIVIKKFRRIIFHGLFLIALLVLLLNASGICLYLTKSLVNYVGAFLLTLTATYLALFALSNPRWSWEGWFQSATVASICFRFWVFPLLQCVSGYVLYVIFSGTSPVQVYLLVRAVLGWILWSPVPIGLYAAEKIRSRMQKQIVAKARGKITQIEQISARELLRTAYKKAFAEYWLEALIEINTYAIQPGKAGMIVVRGIVEMCSYLLGQDTSSWTVGGRAERVAAMLPIIVDVFVCYWLLPNIYNINPLFNFSVYIWATFSISFLWVDEFFQPLYPKSFKNVKVQKFLKALVYYIHIALWFYSAGLVSGSPFWDHKH